jgi:hypothetical protein
MCARLPAVLFLASAAAISAARADVAVVASVEGQPLAAAAQRLGEALDFLGHPLPGEIATPLAAAARKRDAVAIQDLLDPHVLLVVHINPELRVKVSRGPAVAVLHQGGYTPVLVKVLNEGTTTERLRITSPQAGAVYAGTSPGSLQRQQQTELGENQNTERVPGRFLDVSMFTSPPLTPRLSGLECEYAIALVHSSEAGKREATLAFDVGQGTQDLGFRGETPVLFDVRPAVPVKLSIRDVDGAPSVARLTFRDPQGRVYPPQAKRLAPDFFFQSQVYRKDGDVIALPPGTFELTYCRGPEYRELKRNVVVPEDGRATASAGEDPMRASVLRGGSSATSIELQLERWINPLDWGYLSGDHHIHGAGCAHYESPTQGVTPADMFLQVKGEGLNVGCVLTWGPCYDFQRQYFSPQADVVSEPLTVLKYDLEISGFGSQALGHVCLLNLTDQTYPGSEGTSKKGWPTWTVPVMRWAKEQGGVTGYPHSDMRVDPAAYAKRWIARLDANGDAQLTPDEAAQGLLPEPMERTDADRNGLVTVEELTAIADRAANELPNLVLPSMQGAGAMEIVVSVPEGVCDFISAMDTGRIGEWNTWYHLLNCGFPVKVSGETDFPCMSSTRVGQGRVYVRMADGPVEQVDFPAWCAGIAAGRSYVSDGFAHAVEFAVNDVRPGLEELQLEAPGIVEVRANVAFAAETPRAVAHGTIDAPEGRREQGDTRILHVPRSQETVRGGERLVEVVVNGRVAARHALPADAALHELRFKVPIERSSWVALRQFPQLHTNPVNVIVAGRPIRASRDSARWCAESVELLWENRSRLISEAERPAARAAYERALEAYRRRAEQTP